MMQAANFRDRYYFTQRGLFAPLDARVRLSQRQSFASRDKRPGKILGAAIAMKERST